jgi:DNA-binding NarL/FixJ family response regulator
MHVAIADDSRFFRRALANQLAEAGIQVIAEADNGKEIMRRVAQDIPDAVVLDIRMPPGGDGGLMAAEQLRQSSQRLGILALSAYTESFYAVRLLEPDPRGTGYLIKHNVMDINTLHHALNCVVAGESYIDQEVIDCLTLTDGQPAENSFRELSPQQNRILNLIAAGRSNPFITKHLHIKQKTLDSHMANIFENLEFIVTRMIVAARC